jgi:hypothetical protein
VVLACAEIAARRAARIINYKGYKRMNNGANKIPAETVREFTEQEHQEAEKRIGEAENAQDGDFHSYIAAWTIFSRNGQQSR